MSYQLSSPPLCGEPFLGPSLSGLCPGPQFVLFMTIVDMIIRKQGAVSELCERIEPVNSVADEYDFIVVGGGTAGSVVANRLTKKNPLWKVLLIEAGPDEPPGAAVPSMVAMFLGSEIDWQYTTNEKNACLSTNGTCGWSRGKNLGGTSVHHGMMYVRGHKKDYDDWVKLGNDGWSWDDVLPYFKLSENNAEINRVGKRFHGTYGPMNVERFPWQPPITGNILNAAVEAGYGTTEDLAGDKITGFTVAQMTSKNGVRLSSAAAFLRPLRNNWNLDVALNTTATKIIVENDKAVGVEYIRDGKRGIARASKEIIISGGAVDSPRLLLLSGIGPKSQLESVGVPVVKDLPGVGENLHNHISYSLRFTIDQPNVYDLNYASLAEYAAFQEGPMSSTGMSQITGVLSSKHTTPDHPDLQFYFGGYTASCAVNGTIDGLQDNGPIRGISVTPTNLHPISKGYLRLASKDPMAKPIIRANYLEDPRDVAVLVEGIKIAINLMNTKAMTGIGAKFTSQPMAACSNFTFSSDEYWSCAVRQDTGPENHQAGSCKMGPNNDPMAVVDTRLRVRGIRNLRVADTSIMPQVTSGNTAAPAMMIGERAASFIIEEWKRFPRWRYEDFHHHHHYHQRDYHGHRY